MLIAALAFQILHLGPPTVDPQNREAIVKKLGLKKPRPVLTAEELRAHPKVLIEGPKDKKTLALTFDDGPHGDKTLTLMKLLLQLKVPASFFVVGKMLDSNKDVVKQLVRNGFTIENHTWDHPCLVALDGPHIDLEFKKTSQRIFELTGRRPVFCRPSGGQFDVKTLEEATADNLITTLWTDDPGDYALKDADVLYDRLVQQAHPGGVVLLHDGVPLTWKVLPKFVKAMRAKGYRFVPLSDYLTRKRV
jgi:chitin deacetylase